MKNLSAILSSAILISSICTVALADAKPKGWKPASPTKIAKAYAGKTDIWDTGCSGGIYFAPNNEARAWCAESSDNLGAGTWSVDNKGQVCQNITWYWPNNERAAASDSDILCISHVVDRTGRMWRSWPNDPEWWPMGRSSGLVKGYKFQTNVLQARSELGF